MKEDIKERVLDATKAVCPDVSSGVEFEIETPKQKEFGDFSTNAAMALAKIAGEPPRDLAAKLASFLAVNNADIFEKVEVAGPGFVNFFIKPVAIVSKLPGILKAAERFGTGERNGKSVLIEFVSANPTGPLHFGHARNAVVGDVLANLLEFAGWKVFREFYINDAGRQMEMLGESVRANLLGLLGKEAEIPEDGYKGEYIAEIAREIFDGSDAGKVKTDADFCAERAYEKLLDAIKKDLQFIGVEFDNWVSEKELLHSKTGGKNMLDGAMEKLRAVNAVKDEDGAQWFKATEYGDSQDWVLIKKDGLPTYFLADIAYHSEKFSRGCDKLINIWGADHHSHVARIKSAIGASGLDNSALEVLLIQFVRLVRDGKEESMGKRTGSYVTLREVSERVGADVTRFFLLMRAVESHLDFDLELACKNSNENPVYYVQYAHARIESIRRNAAEAKVSANGGQAALLVLEPEIEIAKLLLAFPDVVRDSARTLAPHKIAFYLQGIAASFHSYYNANRVITDDEELSSARLFLCECVRIVIRNGLGILGVSAPERM
ncbi:MAG: arginine--tRNA ligase [Candidatus Mycalebacterium zealandia]|nr:MAG: arginine--tRNA ligase [Candidatus Mycalebacterium zealandia]